MQGISQAFRCFDGVARHGSVRKAAQALHLTAAAVHQQVLNFEGQVGAPLFDRLPRGMQLTAAGEIVLASVRRSQRDFEQALAQVEALRTLGRGQVRLGTPHSSAEVLMPRVIAAMLDRHPGIGFAVRTGHGETLLRWLAQGEIDVAFCLERVPPAGVEQVRTWPQQLGAVVSPRHALARHRGRLRLRDCLVHALALPGPEMELRVMAERIAARDRRALAPLLETSSVAMIRALAAAGSVVGLLVQENVVHDVEQKRLVWRPLADADARSRIGLYQRIGQAPSAATQAFVQCLDAALGGLTAAFGRPARDALAGSARTRTVRSERR
ncbi:MAG: LysR family transcriptional regulator [Burkholderiaceae bacterium]